MNDNKILVPIDEATAKSLALWSDDWQAPYLGITLEVNKSAAWQAGQIAYIYLDDEEAPVFRRIVKTGYGVVKLESLGLESVSMAEAVVTDRLVGIVTRSQVRFA